MCMEESGEAPGGNATSFVSGESYSFRSQLKRMAFRCSLCSYECLTYLSEAEPSIPWKTRGKDLETYVWGRNYKAVAHYASQKKLRFAIMHAQGIFFWSSYLL